MMRSSVLSIVACLLVLAACGGGQTIEGPTVPHLLATTTSAASYNTVVQQLYIAYFGRPADVGGLASFSGQLAALNAPTDIQQLAAAYKSNAQIRALIDSFSTSAESSALYSGNDAAFVTAIYSHVLGRAPDADGLAFWSKAISSGELTKANASLSIMAGALLNSSSQGQLDGKLVNNKVAIGSNFTTAASGTAVDVFRGDAAAAEARSMLDSVTATTDVTAFQSTIASVLVKLACGAYALPPSPGTRPSCGP